MHVEALQWPSCIFTRRVRATCHQVYELGYVQCLRCHVNVEMRIRSVSQALVLLVSTL